MRERRAGGRRRRRADGDSGGEGSVHTGSRPRSAAARSTAAPTSVAPPSSAGRRSQVGSFTEAPSRPGPRTPVGPGFGEESAEWLSQIIGEMWPYASSVARDVFKDYIEPAVAANMPGVFPPLAFTRVELGSRAPRVEAVAALPGGAERPDLVALEADLSYDGNPLIELTVGSPPTALQFGVTNVRFRGRAELLVRPLLPRLPLVGATQFAFVNPPFIDFELTGAAAWADVDLFRSTFRRVTDQVIAALCVLPNRVSFKMDPRIDFLSYVAHPIGVLRVAVLQGTGFPNTDETIVNRGHPSAAPDVYITLQHGGVVKTTYRVDDDCNPVYRNQVFDFVLTSSSKHQNLIIRAYDYDLGQQDDELGMAHVKVADLVANEQCEVPLHDAPQDAKPTVYLMARWLPLSSDLSRVQTAILTQRAEEGRPGQCSRLLLTINISEAVNLPPCTRPYVKARYGSEVNFETWTACEVPGVHVLENPKFEVSFHALLGEIAANSRVELQVVDQGSGGVLGVAFALLSDIVARKPSNNVYVFALLDCVRPDSSLRASIKVDAVIDSPPLWTAIEDALVNTAASTTSGASASGATTTTSTPSSARSPANASSSARGHSSSRTTGNSRASANGGRRRRAGAHANGN